jgi:hypothetical protein
MPTADVDGSSPPRPTQLADLSITRTDAIGTRGGLRDGEEFSCLELGVRLPPVPAWITDPYGYILSFALVAVLMVAQGMSWTGHGARSNARPESLKVRLMTGMQGSNAGRRWLRHPWRTGIGMVVLALVAGAVFNTVGRH